METGKRGLKDKMWRMFGLEDKLLQFQIRDEYGQGCSEVAS